MTLVMYPIIAYSKNWKVKAKNCSFWVQFQGKCGDNQPTSQLNFRATSLTSNWLWGWRESFLPWSVGPSMSLSDIAVMCGNRETTIL